MTRLQRTNTLLDFGEVRVANSRLSVSQRVTRREKEASFPARYLAATKRTEVQSLGTLNVKAGLEPELEGHEKEVLGLLDTLQEANFVASGRKALFGRHESSQFIPAK